MEEHGKGFYRRVRDADLLRYSGELVFCEGAFQKSTHGRTYEEGTEDGVCQEGCDCL